MVLLIKQQDLTKNTPLGGNIDEAKYIPAVKSAQITSIKPLLGAKLYDKIVAGFTDGTLSGDYVRLYDDYIKPMLVHLSASYYLTTGAYQIDNRGITRHTSDNAVGVSKEDIDYIVKQQDKLYDFYKREFYANIGYYNVPEYSENPATKASKRIGGWALGGSACTSRSNSYSDGQPIPPIELLESGVKIINDYLNLGVNVGNSQEDFNIAVNLLLGQLIPAPTYVMPSLSLFLSGVSDVMEFGSPFTSNINSTFTKNDAGDLTKIEALANDIVVGEGDNVVHSDTVPNGVYKFQSRAYYSDGPIKENPITGELDDRGAIPAGVVNSPSRTITGLIPWFYKIFDDAPDLSDLDLSTFTKMISPSTGDVTIPSLNVVKKFVVVVIPATSPVKNFWYCTPNNTGEIGEGNVFDNPVLEQLSSPEGYWGTQDFNVYSTSYKTDFTPILRLTN